MYLWSLRSRHCVRRATRWLETHSRSSLSPRGQRRPSDRPPKSAITAPKSYYAGTHRIGGRHSEASPLHAVKQCSRKAWASKIASVTPMLSSSRASAAARRCSELRWRIERTGGFLRRVIIANHSTLDHSAGRHRPCTRLLSRDGNQTASKQHRRWPSVSLRRWLLAMIPVTIDPPPIIFSSGPDAGRPKHH